MKRETVNYFVSYTVNNYGNKDKIKNTVIPMLKYVYSLKDIREMEKYIEEEVETFMESTVTIISISQL